MEAREAIKRIREHNKVHSKYEGFRALRITEAIELSILALEKQVPRKIYHHEWVGIDGVPYDLCPTCKHNLCTTGMLASKKTTYCPECGQKLDW